MAVLAVKMHIRKTQNRQHVQTEQKLTIYGGSPYLGESIMGGSTVLESLVLVFILNCALNSYPFKSADT